MKDFHHHYLTEADTSAATNTEVAICYEYNLIREKDHEKALEASGVSQKDFDKLTPDLLVIGKKVAKQMGNRGSLLVHSGKATAGKNFYEGGRDKTPKADFFGNSKNYISLKKAGASGSGAQLMSAKSAEAAGVVKAAVSHLESASGSDLTGNPQFESALNILEKGMLATARNDLNVEVSKGKKSFEEWYVNQSDRRALVMRKEKNAKKVEAHLKAELSIAGATRATRGAESKLVPGITPPSGNDLKKIYDEYMADSDFKVGNVTVSASHLKNVSADKLTDPALKKQVIDIIETSVSSQAWQNELGKFFSDNEALKKWIVYEAGSGLYKFTGMPSDGRSYGGPNSNVANRILVFNNSGIASEYDMMDYASTHTSLVNKVSVSYKGSGRSKYIKLGIASAVEHELPTLKEEWQKLEHSYLTEGVFGNIKAKFNQFVQSAKRLMRKFYENVIKKVVGNLRALGKKGMNSFLDTVGLDYTPRLSLDTPSW